MFFDIGQIIFDVLRPHTCGGFFGRMLPVFESLTTGLTRVTYFPKKAPVAYSGGAKAPTTPYRDHSLLGDTLLSPNLLL
ncbi:MAG: hypothetical protein ACFFC7_15175 [Candidatus Hermodarchaeota archaeon]